MNQLILILVMFLTVGLSHGMAFAEDSAMPSKAGETVQADKDEATSDEANLEDAGEDADQGAGDLEKAPADDVIPGPATTEDAKKDTM